MHPFILQLRQNRGGAAGMLGALALTLAFPGQAQTEEPIAKTVADISEVLKREEAAIHGARGVPVFLSKGRGFLYQPDGAGGMTILRIDSGAASVEPLLSPDKLADAFAAARIDGSRAQLDSASEDLSVVYFRTPQGLVSFDRRRGAVARDPDRDRWSSLHRPQVISNQFPQTYGDLVEAMAPNGEWFVTQRKDDLWLRSVGGVTRRLTHDGAPNLTWGGTDESAQQFPVFWSPDSKKIATVLLDNRNVPSEPLAHYLSPGTEIQNVPFSRVGEPISKFSLFVFDADTGARVRLETGDTTGNYVNLLGWSADGAAVYYQVVSRDQKVVTFFRGDAQTGRASQVARQEARTYIDTPFSLGPQLLTPLSASDGFLLFSERDGLRRLYRHSGDGQNETPLGAELGLVTRIVALDDAHGQVFVLAADKDERPYDTALYRLPLDGGAADRLTRGPGVREVWPAPDASGFVVRTSDPLTPPKVDYVSADGRRAAEVSSADVSALKAMGFTPPEQFATPALAGAFDVRGVILKPFNFDPARRYPVVEMIYGGMQVSHTPKGYYGYEDRASGYNSVPARILLHHGFVVVYIDAPGTPGRGRAYQDATYGIWPGTVVGNHAKWIRDAARDRPWMDLERVGVFGSSWGGFLSQHALAQAPDLYKVAVSMAAVSDLEDHQMYIEPFMGLAQSNAGNYAAASIYPRIKDIRGRVLSIGFPLDINAGFSPTMKFVDAMVAADKDIELFVLPSINHQVTCCDPHSATYAYALITRYFRRWLAQP